MWSWNSEVILFNQTCWWYDGFNGCAYEDFEIFSFMLYITKKSEHAGMITKQSMCDVEIAKGSDHVVEVRKQLSFTKFISKIFSVT